MQLHTLQLLACFAIGFFNEWGELVTDRTEIWHRYKKNGFLIDSFACLPLELLGDLAGLDRGTRAMAFLRLTRVARVHRLFDDDKGGSGSNVIVRLLRLLMSLVLFSHWFGCAFFGLGLVQDGGNIWLGPQWTVAQNLENADLFTQVRSLVVCLFVQTCLVICHS
jgi:hypothetical protein